MFAGVKKVIVDYLYPTYTPPDFVRAVSYSEPKKETPSAPKQDKMEFVGFNDAGNVVKIKTFEWGKDGSTEWAKTQTFAKGRAENGDIIAELTAEDVAQLEKRKPRVPNKTAAKIKAVFAAKHGAVTSGELQQSTGYSRAYCDAALAAFRAAL